LNPVKQKLLGQIVVNLVEGPASDGGNVQTVVNVSPGLTHHKAVYHLLTGANALVGQLTAPAVPQVQSATPEQVPPAPAFNGKSRS
jgi:hypothetical protein